ncbi:MAG: hypothetical protein M1827_007531 [Pycnora praestabilis]|nr:MAG: hypothetical protein M1827_007531 [Pycnora praestabilis]
MAAQTSLPALLSTLITSLDTVTSTVPEPTKILPPQDGISLLDTKNELLLSYLQNLAFLIIVKLRNGSASSEGIDNGGQNGITPSSETFDNKVVQRLVELRVYLEKGVRPLEGRLKYQIDKVLRAADDAARITSEKSNRAIKEHVNDVDKVASDSDSDSDSDSEDVNDGNEAPAKTAAEIDDLSYRPNPSALSRPAQANSGRTPSVRDDRIYRPPRITPTALPATTSRQERTARKPPKSATLDEFISTELSTAPVAEPSIGSTIRSGGRHSKSQKERDADAERNSYEESNFVRLPKESKKDRAKKGGRGREKGYGGEEWRGLGEGVDRIDRMTQKKRGVTGVLERSRKRPVEDRPRGGGAEIGERFEKRRKMQAPRVRKR